MVLAKKWGISPEKACNAICHTTQHGVCTVLHPSLSRQFRTNDCQLIYRRLPHNVYSDTLFAITVYRRGNRYAQIFATDFGWSCSFPMKLKSEAHESLFLLFQWDEVPLAIICDNVKERIFGEFNRILKEASRHLKQMEPFTPWLKATEREIKELKIGSGRKLIKSGAPKRLLDDCLEHESYIRYNTALGI